MRPVLNAPGYYVTRDGRVLSSRVAGSPRLTGPLRELRPWLTVWGTHPRVALRINGRTVRRYVHVLVREAWEEGA